MKVSVVMPVRDGGDCLQAAVRSILDQSLTDLELLLVDDHSSDHAIEWLDRSDRRLRIMASEGKGIVAALNTGLKHCRGAFIARMDADDISLPSRLQEQLDYLVSRPEVGIAGGKVKMFSGNDVAGGYRRYEQWINALEAPEQIHRELFIECPLPHPSLFMRREVLDVLGEYRDQGWAEDYDLLLRADAAGIRMGKPGGLLLHWRDHGQRLSRSHPRYRQAQFVRAKARFLADYRVGGRDVVIWGAGRSGRGMHDALAEVGVRTRAFLEVHPRRLGKSKRQLPVHPITDVRNFAGALILVAVGVPSARPEISAFLLEREFAEGRDFLFVA